MKYKAAYLKTIMNLIFVAKFMPAVLINIQKLKMILANIIYSNIQTILYVVWTADGAEETRFISVDLGCFLWLFLYVNKNHKILSRISKL